MPYYEIELCILLTNKETIYFDTQEEAQRHASELSTELGDSDYDHSIPVWWAREVAEPVVEAAAEPANASQQAS